ncbi:Ribosome-releasing factor 2, mitochondrial [Mycoblastus sanguinarius]|nr:Ribosome-releasing factor 2, mitochondrial [Mycoblastus sanguinarius]
MLLSFQYLHSHDLSLRLWSLILNLKRASKAAICLFLLSLTKYLDVDEGSTVTDFLPAERARGVTIQSAAISFHWPPLPSEASTTLSTKSADIISHNINLIDTPGHADFTFEVLRSLRILDGAVCILDGVAGVEAQTEKVWYQAAKYHIPKIIYVNKLDRDGAAFGKTVKQIAARLHTWPAVCQIPWWEGGKDTFIGLGDAIGLRALRWPNRGDGKSFEVTHIDDLPESEASFVREIKKARRALVEVLSNEDEAMIEKYLEAQEDHLAIKSSEILNSLRRCILKPASNLVPVFAGASFQNMGVQPLLDAVVQLLPSPNETPDPEIIVGGMEGTLPSLLNGKMISVEGDSKAKARYKKPSTALIQNLDACALAFKVVHDPRRGALVYVRVYSGSITRQSVLFNTNLQISERAPQLLKMYASDSVQIDSIPAGQIGVIPGLKHARTGDTLISYAGTNPKTGPPAPLNTLQLRPIEVPPAVFFSSVEPHSLTEEKAVKSALALLVREDPSLQVSEDEESGQTLLSGMGEFHLEIARDRLVNDLRAKAAMGKIEIAYRESILKASEPDLYAFDREQGGKQGKASCIATVAPLIENSNAEVNDGNTYSTSEDGNTITISISPPSDPSSTSQEPWDGSLPPHLTLPLLHSALKNGALGALSRGINYAFPMHSTHVHLTLDPLTHLFGSETTPTALSSAARLATKGALKATALENGSALMELVMNVTISVDEASLGAVSNDISSARGGHIMSLDDGDITSGPTVNETREELPRLDLSKVYAPPDPFGPSSQTQELGIASDGTRQRNITARVPLKEMVGYLKHLRSLTRGRGTFVMSADRFERVVGQREKVLLRELRGY